MTYLKIYMITLEIILFISILLQRLSLLQKKG